MDEVIGSPELRVINVGFDDAVEVGSLNPHPKNPRRGNVEVIRESIRANGFYGSVLARQSDRLIGAGEHRWRAAQAEGLAAVPVTWIECDDATLERIMLADNRSNDVATYDGQVLLELLSSSAQVSESLLGTGYLQKDLQALLNANPPEVPSFSDPDDVPSVPEEPTSQVGDIWYLGDHRLVCGDSARPETFRRLMGDELADFVWTDPPYGVDIQESDMQQAEIRGRRKDGLGVTNDDLTGDSLAELLRAVFKSSRAYCKPGSGWFVAGPGGVDLRIFLNVLDELGIARHTLVWVKDRFVMGRADYHYRHEALIYGWVPGAAHHEPPSRDQDTVWEIPRPGRSLEHPTMKPVELVSRAIRNHTDVGSVVLDPFAGSGTTVIAAHESGRKARCIEIDPRYCDVIVQRWKNHTGLEPQREQL